MDGVEVRFIDDKKGKGLFATRNFEKGSVLFEEEPIVCCQFSWNAAYGYLACDHCMRPLETAQDNARRLTGKTDLVLPYPQCCTTNLETVVTCPACGVRYCSEDCRTRAYSNYHQVLCLKSDSGNGKHPLEQLNEAWKQIHYPPETSSIMLIARVIATIQQSPNLEAASTFTQFCNRTVNEDAQIIHKLHGDQFSSQVELVRSLAAAALPTEGLEHCFTLEGFQSLLALIGTNGQGVGTSPISSWYKNCMKLPLSDSKRSQFDAFVDKLYEDMDHTSGEFLNSEGCALFALQSNCNHSCRPNVQLEFLHNNFRLSVVALENIEADEEICISYLDECNLERSRHSRQKMLAENYLFLCDCSKCQEQVDDPDLTSEEEMSESD